MGLFKEKAVLDDPMSEMVAVKPTYYYCSIVYLEYISTIPYPIRTRLLYQTQTETIRHTV